MQLRKATQKKTAAVRSYDKGAMAAAETTREEPRLGVAVPAEEDALVVTAARAFPSVTPSEEVRAPHRRRSRVAARVHGFQDLRIRMVEAPDVRLEKKNWQ